MGVAVQDIVHAFLQTYYQRMRKDPSKVSYLYSATAELTHINYQVDFNHNADVLPTIKLTGRENISKFFTRNNKKVSDLKAKIDTCDFQTMGSSHTSILILTTGEMFWTGTPAYKFCQTIILKPNADNKDAFDVTNDVIRFISDNLTPYVTKSPEAPKLNDKKNEIPLTNGTSTTNDTAQNGDTKTSKEPDSEPAKVQPMKNSENNTGEDTSIDKTVDKAEGGAAKGSELGKDDQAVRRKEISDKSNATQETDPNNARRVEKTSKNDEETASSKNKSNDSDIAAPKPAPPVRMSWASKLAANSESFKTTVTIAGNENAKSEVQPTNNKKLHETKHDLPSRKENSSNKATKKKPLFSTVNKDGFYPIYIKGTAGVKEEKLKSTLESEFGTIMKMTTADSFAVVDFETQRSQMDALERKQLMVGDIEVYLSRKTLKKSSSSPPLGSSSSARSHKKHSSKKRE